MKYIAQTLVCIAFLLSHGLAAGEPGYVVVDSSNKHATTYVSLPRTTSQTQLEEVRAKMAAHSGSYVTDWKSFLADLESHVTAKIRKNDYPEVKTLDGLVALLQKFERTAFGLTWNGGLAITYNDYMFAQRTYDRHLSDPTYVARPRDRRGDPVHPGNHTDRLLGR